ncbi:MAG: DUF4438 domain-containing protein [Chloroflexi bacterium]|nr:DUF4438 domain-containing protein [Chloroflexota bacterium]
MDLKTNRGQLVEMAVVGYVSQPTVRGYIPEAGGRARILPGMSGMIYNARVGDPAFGWAADHLEPGASIAHPNLDADYAMHYLTCMGNRAVIMSGLARGSEGIVTGEHARLLVDFPPDVAELINVGDAVQIRTIGQGLQLTDYPHIMLKKCSPQLIESLPIEAVDERTIRVRVTMELPIQIMGSGAELNPDFVDQDLMSGDRALMADLGIDQMKLGDLVVINNADHRYGRGYKPGAVTIGLCIHGDSIMTGHGPGILTLMTCAEPCIEWVIDPTANIANYLQIRG